MDIVLKNIEALIKESGISQEKLAESIGFSKSGFNRSLKARNIKVVDLIKISQILNVEANQLFLDQDKLLDDKLNKETINYLPIVLNYLNFSVNDFCTITGIKKLKFFSKAKEYITSSSIQYFCMISNFPFELFY